MFIHRMIAKPMFFLVIAFRKNFCTLENMSQPKEPIPIKNIEQLADVLQTITDSLRKAATDFRESEMEVTMMEGWPTLHRGLEYVVKQCRKLTGPSSRLYKIDLDAILLPHHLADKKAESEDEEKIKNAAERVVRGRRSKPKS